MVAYHLVFPAVHGISESAGLFARFHTHGWTKRKSYTAISLHQLDVALENIAASQIIVSRNQPNIFSARFTDPFVVVPELAEVLFVTYVSDTRILK
jgi:hypothetical protein